MIFTLVSCQGPVRYVSAIIWFTADFAETERGPLSKRRFDLVERAAFEVIQVLLWEPFGLGLRLK